jgi:hypothetical protein
MTIANILSMWLFISRVHLICNIEKTEVIV